MFVLIILLSIQTVYSRCSSNEVAVQRNISDMSFQNDYYTCSGSTFKGDKLIPEMNGCSNEGFFVYGEEDFTPCCNLHDMCFQTCGITHHQCETDFLKCMKQMCIDTYPDNKKCVQASKIWTLTTSILGTHLYKCYQDIFCICIDKQEEESHYKRFYKNVGIQFPWNINFYQIMKEYPNVFGEPYVPYINNKQKTAYEHFLNVVSYVSDSFTNMFQKVNLKRN